MEREAPRGLADQPDQIEEFVEDIPDDDLDEGEGQPGSAEAPPAEGAAAPGDQPAPAATPPGAQPRDESGRFAKKPDATPAAPSGEPGAPASAPPQPQPAGQGFEFEADGDRWNISGSQVHDDGSITIPKAQVELVQGLLAEGVHHRRSWRTELAERERAWQQRLDQAESRAAVGDKLFTSLKALLDQGPERVAEWLDDVAANMPAMLAEAQRAGEERGRQTLEQRLAEYEERDAAEALVPALERALADTISELSAKYPGVPPEEIKRKLYEDGLESLFFQADRDMPEYGLTAGQYAIRQDLVERQFAFVHGLLKDRGDLAAIEERNRRALADGRVPPSVGGGAAPAASEEKMPEFPTTDEGRAAFDKWWKQKYGGAVLTG
jgi:hypothetical protein